MSDEKKTKTQTPWNSPQHSGKEKQQVKVTRMPSNVRQPGTRIKTKK
jgi:hypothetical protein